MPRRPAPLPSELRDGFAVADARRLGISRARTRAADLDTPFRGVRLPRARPTTAVDGDPLAADRAQQAQVQRLARAYASIAPAGAFIAGRSALALHRLPVVCGDSLEVAVLSPGRAPRGRGVTGRRIVPSLVRVHTWHGLRVATPASAWAMLGDDLSVRDLVRLGNAIVRVPRVEGGRRMPEQACATIAQLRAATDAGRRGGVANLRAALESIRI